MFRHYRLTAVFALSVSVMLLAGCGGGTQDAPLVPDRSSGVPASPSDGTVSAADVSHEPTGGTEGFFFLPPLAPASEPGGSFDPEIADELLVDVFLLGDHGWPVGEAVASFTSERDRGASGSIRVDVRDELYVVNFRTRDYDLARGETYRIFVRRQSDNAIYGYADVQISAGPSRAGPDDDASAVTYGQTLPVKFRIEVGAEPGGVPDVIVASPTVIIPDDGSVQLVSINGSVYTFSGALPDIHPGDIVVSALGEGLLRQVVAVSSAGGETIVDTADATLSDAINRGTYTSEIDMAHAELVTPAGAVVRPQQVGPQLAYDLSGTTLIDDGGLTVQIASGTVAFTPKILTDMRFGWDGVEYFKLAASGTLDLEMTVEAEAALAQQWSHEMTLYSIKHVYVQFIGPVPVVEVVMISFVGGVEADAAVTTVVEQSIDASANLVLGAEYSGGWSPVVSHSFDVDGGGLELGVTGEANLRAYVRPELRVMFYAVAGPSIDLEPYLKFHEEIDFVNATYAWELGGGATSDLAFNIGILDEDLARYEYRLLDWYTDPPLAEGSGAATGDVPVTISDARRGAMRDAERRRSRESAALRLRSAA